MLDFSAYIQAAVKQLPQGAFLLSGENSNPMTIGWAQWGVIWGKPICTVLVRHSRYSHGLMEKGVFTVSVPYPDVMKEELKLCGSRSGRDMDKLKAAGLTLLPSRINGISGIAGCAAHFECKTLLKTEVSMEQLDPQLYRRYYSPTDANGNDHHTLYFGEILAAYGE